MLENSLKEKLQLYAVTDRNCLREKTLYEAVEEALKGGVTLLQLREKTSSVGAIIKEMKDLHPLCVRYGVPLIVNDSIEIASACNADGVHLGQGDGSIREARHKPVSYTHLDVYKRQV